MSEGFNATLEGETSPEQVIETLQSEMQQIIEEGQAAG